MATYQSTIKDFFTAWANRDWGYVENLLADDFTFTSQYDDHIDKQGYKQNCWDMVTEMDVPEFITIMEKGEDVLVRYKGRVNGEAVQNVEHFTFRDGKIMKVEVFFGRPDA